MPNYFSQKPEASIIIITRNQRGFLKRSLPAIFEQTLKDFEVIAVDSGSTDGALELMKKYPIEMVHYKGPVGPEFNYARVFNMGAKQAKGKFLVRLSGDAIPANKFWLANLLEPFLDSKIGGTYSKQIYTSSADPGQRLLYFFAFSRFHWFFEKVACNLMFWGTSCAIRRDLWQKIPFDEAQKRMEDARWSLEISKLGYKTVYAPSSIVYHTHQRGWRTIVRVFWPGSVKFAFLYLKALYWTLRNKVKFLKFDKVF